jgi:hypothetical protein
MATRPVRVCHLSCSDELLLVSAGQAKGRLERVARVNGAGEGNRTLVFSLGSFENEQAKQGGFSLIRRPVDHESAGRMTRETDRFRFCLQYQEPP